MELLVLTALCVLVLSAIHLTAPMMRFLEGTPRSIWLSIAGGVSVAYVFVHFLPELASGQKDIAAELRSVDFAERHVYLIALAGLLTFYGLDRLAKADRSRHAGRPVSDGRGAKRRDAPPASSGVFWIHMASFGVYNAIIGYLLLHREKMTLGSLLFFAVAMALHFLVTDYGLNEDHKSLFRSLGRWILAGTLALGWLIGALTEVGKPVIAALTAFLGGGVVLNVLKEEVPSEQQSRFWAFAAGASAYSLLLLTL
ncbi:hypothetical protein M8312_04885 [Sphingomonas sp. KRR8]|uniref:hypothetical protein n=1 Tax=Sphingomonas sp. KRR8 TaxID=2942996 RepID=UPI002021F101|nr:hypothetical protein [Sphingomonas sp. KRR8]URD61851.1 hypothetical protein M8312_04885 [Sphingomonas sp. KRR8]